MVQLACIKIGLGWGFCYVNGLDYCLATKSLTSKFAIRILCPLRIVLAVQWTSMGRPLDLPPSLTRLVPLSCPVHMSNGHPCDVHWTSHHHRVGFSHCPIHAVHLSNRGPWDVHWTSHLTDWACSTVLSSPPVQWTSHPHRSGLSWTAQCAWCRLLQVLYTDLKNCWMRRIFFKHSYLIHIACSCAEATMY